MTYDPNIPVGSDLVSQDIIAMQQNFLVLNNSMDIDHYNYSPGTAETGMHKQVQFPNVPSIPAPPVVAGIGGAVYTKAVSGFTELFYKNNTTDSQLTNIPLLPNVIGNNGYVTLQNGLIMQWGVKTGPWLVAQTIPIVFVTELPLLSNINFSVACYNVQVSLVTADMTTKSAIVSQGTLSTTGFSITVTSASNSFYWFAIGK